MHKNTYFTVQPIFSQIINLIPRNKVKQLSNEFKTDRYYKKFKTYDHLISMLYCIFNNCTSIREVVTGLLACETKLLHLGLNYSVRRSTLSEANCNRTEKVFEAIYKVLYSKYRDFLPDSHNQSWRSRLYIFDSTTISLFQEILKNAGRSPMNGKRKGGIKAHPLIKSNEDVPCLVEFTSAAAHDVPFMKSIDLPNGSIAVFDRAYVDYNIFAQWEKQSISFVTRIRKRSVYEVIGDFEVSQAQTAKGIISDKGILTNNFTLAPSTIAEIYKCRWQIESLFKRIKQNYPLKNFLGDNENAIKIQIWCALIADLLLQVIKKSVKRKWAFSNLASMIRLHLMNYIHLGIF